MLTCWAESLHNTYKHQTIMLVVHFKYLIILFASYTSVKLTKDGKTLSIIIKSSYNNIWPLYKISMCYENVHKNWEHFYIILKLEILGLLNWQRKKHVQLSIVSILPIFIFPSSPFCLTRKLFLKKNLIKNPF